MVADQLADRHVRVSTDLLGLEHRVTKRNLATASVDAQRLDEGAATKTETTSRSFVDVARDPPLSLNQRVVTELLVGEAMRTARPAAVPLAHAARDHVAAIEVTRVLAVLLLETASHAAKELAVRARVALVLVARAHAVRVLEERVLAVRGPEALALVSERGEREGEAKAFKAVPRAGVADRLRRAEADGAKATLARDQLPVAAGRAPASDAERNSWVRFGLVENDATPSRPRIRTQLFTKAIRRFADGFFVGPCLTSDQDVFAAPRWLPPPMVARIEPIGGCHELTREDAGDRPILIPRESP